MEIYDAGGMLVWLQTEPIDLPAPPGLEWMTQEQLEGYYLLFSDENQ